jgi:hypothetical protein
VGAFGYFDTATRLYQLFSPPEVAPYEISAILVEKDTVWLGLNQFVEDISKSPGGLAVWNRTTRQIQRYPLEFNIDSIVREGDSLRLATKDGYAIFTNGTIRRFQNGHAVDRFPPLPSHY